MYTPRYVAGARLPHAWAYPLNSEAVLGVKPVDLSYVDELPIDDVQQRRYSTLDLCCFDSFTLLLGSGLTAQSRGRQVKDLLRISAKGKAVPPLRVLQYGVDFTVRSGERADEFLDKFGLNDEVGGGVLVRPDQHILLTLAEKTSVNEIVNAIMQHLGRRNSV
jgi:hypothetical protein